MITDRSFGIEIEFVFPDNHYGDYDDFAQLVSGQGIDCRNKGYSHNIVNYWKLVPDGSVAGGAEIVSPILRGEEGVEQVVKMCNILRKLNCKVNNTCGLHVHIGVEKEVEENDVKFFKNLLRIYTSFEHVIDSFMPPSRRASANSYCASLKDINPQSTEEFKTVADVMRARFGRYYKINMESLNNYKTVEFRQHSGTLDGTKIVSWINFCFKIVEKAKTEIPEVFAPSMIEETVLQNPVMPYIRHRYSAEKYIVDLLFSRGQQGLTTEEAKRAFEATTSLGAIIRKHDIPVKVVQEGHKKRFIVSPVEKKVKKFQYRTDPNFFNFDNLIKFVGLNNLETAFFQERMESLNA